MFCTETLKNQGETFAQEFAQVQYLALNDVSLLELCQGKSV